MRSSTRSSTRARPGNSVVLALLLSAVSAAGCDVTPEKIQRWKETEKGPSRLRETLKSPSVALDLRSLALTALVELGMTSDAMDDLKSVPEVQKRELIHGAVRPLVALAEGAGKASGGGPAKEDSTKHSQREAKDALFLLRDGAAPEDRAVMDDELIAWTTVDLAARMTAGSRSTDQILGAIGARAGSRLSAVVSDENASEASRREAARLIGKLADRGVREQAGTKLVERARRERRVKEETLQAIGLVGGDHAVAYLTGVAEDAHVPAEVRQKSLFALAQGGDPAALSTALRLASDKATDGDVREAAFQLAEKIGPSSVPGLCKLLDSKEELVRWRSVEAALAAGKAGAIATVLDGLSTARSYSKDDLDAYVVHQVTLVGPAALPSLRELLRSKSWVSRLSAVEAIGQLGRAADAAALDALGSDGTKLKGWPGNPTLGAESRAVAATLRVRH